MFVLQTNQKRYAAALNTYRKMKQMKPPVTDAEVERVADEIKRMVDGPAAISFPGEIEYRSGCEEGKPNWQHELLRRKFAFDEIEGNVDTFELRCDWKRVVDKVSTDKTWEVPKSWGWCQVFVFGDVGAKAKLIEYPLAAEEKGAPAEPLSFQ
jgi:hypothetical protein